MFDPDEKQDPYYEKMLVSFEKHYEEALKLMKSVEILDSAHMYAMIDDINSFNRLWIDSIYRYEEEKEEENHAIGLC